MNPLVARLRLDSRSAIAFVLGAGFCLVFASLSPLRGGLPLNDSSVFLNIGRAILEGKVPFRDIFDHKGPITFMIDALGLALGFGSPYGVFVLEILSLCLVLYLANRCLGDAKPIFVLAVDLTLLALLNQCFEAGNLTEEYILLPSAISIFLYSRKARSRSYYPIQAILFSIVFFIRPNGITAVGGIIILSMLGDISAHRIKAFLGAVAICLAIFAAFWLAFVAYFAANGALGDFMDGLLLFSLKYSATSLSQKASGLLFFLSTFQVWIFAVAGACAFALAKGKAGIAAELAFMAAIALASIALSGQEFGHYFMLFIPVIFLAILRSTELWDAQSREASRALVLCALAAFALGFRPNGRGLPLDDLKYRQAIKSAGIRPTESALAICMTKQSRFFLYSGIRVSQKWFLAITHNGIDGEDKIALTKAMIQARQPDYLLLDDDWLSANRGDPALRGYAEILSIDSDASKVLRRID